MAGVGPERAQIDQTPGPETPGIQTPGAQVPRTLHPGRNFTQFWKLYLDAHRHPTTRAWHYVATVTGILATVAAVLFDEIFLAVAGIACAYVMALYSHRRVERNQSLMTINPLFGYIADLRMCWMALTGRLAGEYSRHGLAPLNVSRFAQGAVPPGTTEVVAGSNMDTSAN